MLLAEIPHTTPTHAIYSFPRAGQSFVPSFIPQATDAIDSQGISKFETAEHDTEEAQREVTYGLIKRRRRENEPLAGASSARQPITETEAFHRDLGSLPPEASLEAYETMPVEAFGEALLRGMGWHEGRGVGRGAKADVTTKDTVRRPQRLGLGASPAPPPPTHIKKSSSGSIPGSNNNGAPTGAPGPQDRAPPLERRMPSSCDKNMASDSLQNPKAILTLSEERPGKEGKTKKVAREPWLVPNIRVKIIDKRAYKGRLYLKKGTVVDVKTSKVCDMYVEDLQESVLDVHQDQLETVVPKSAGAAIVVVAGKYKGRRGRLLQRSSTSDIAAVQLIHDMSVHKLGFDDIAEYFGPPEDWDDG